MFLGDKALIGYSFVKAQNKIQVLPYRKRIALELKTLSQFFRRSMLIIFKGQFFVDNELITENGRACPFTGNDKCVRHATVDNISDQ